MQNVAADPAASAALDFFCIHGYAGDGVTASGATPTEWNWWLNGWTSSPAAGIPANVKGTSAFGKKSWMTETSGEAFLKFIRPNSVRVACSVSNRPGLDASAYLGPLEDGVTPGGKARTWSPGTWR